MNAVLSLENFKAVRRKYIRTWGKPLLRRFDRFVATQSLVPDAPVYDNTAFPWVSILEENWQDIRSELENVLRYREDIPRFQDISPDQYKISPDNLWRTFALFGFGYRSDLGCEMCPKTAALLEQIPELRTAFFSILAPGKHVPKHKGVTKSYLRCHLGLVVPKDRENCWMDVDTNRMVWEEGKAFMFDDTYPHEVRNDTDEERVVLLIDVERPMRWRGMAMSRLSMWLLRRTAYVKDAMRNQLSWEARMRDRLKAQGVI